MLKGENLKKIYSAFEKNYNELTGGTFKFKSGEKGRVKNIFTLMREAVGRDEDFETVFSFFCSYIKDVGKDWLRWDKGNRHNFIGFLLNEENINIYVAKKSITDQDNSIVGTETEEEWDF